MGESFYLCGKVRTMVISLRIYDRSKKRRSEDERMPLYVRVRDGREFCQEVKTQLMVPPTMWDERREMVKVPSVISLELKAEVALTNKAITDLRSFLTAAYTRDKAQAGALQSGWLGGILDKFYEKKEVIPVGEIFDEYLSTHLLADSRKKQFQVLKRIFQRYELYVRATRPHAANYAVDLTEFTVDDLGDMWEFVLHEHEILEQHAGIYDEFPDNKQPKPGVRSINTVCGIFKRIRAFFNWCRENGYMTADLFKEFHIEAELYGTPIILTSEEVKQIWQADLSDNKYLEEQRDIFIFQCNVGCRVGDLLKFTKADIYNGTLSYIPSKTMKSSGRTITVPLNSIAQTIVDKYEDLPGERLLPFLLAQDYNDAIKLVLHRAGVERQVVVLDPQTRTEKKASIASIAASHLARRTFTGLLYKQVKDPNLVGSLTGHVEGSRAFLRYRNIDEDMKKDLVKLLEQ